MLKFLGICEICLKPRHVWHRYGCDIPICGCPQWLAQYQFLVEEEMFYEQQDADFLKSEDGQKFLTHLPQWSKLPSEDKTAGED